nr:tyrosine-protein phosphatase [Rhodococcus sp. HNM0569]
MRDLGGIATRTGTVRPGVVIRADDLSLADSESAARLADDGLTAVVDLRTADEVRLTGRGPLGALPVTYHHVPFIASVAATTRDVVGGAAFDQSRFAAMYIDMFESAAPRIVTALSIIAHSRGTVAFHCAAGQDRTGVLAASLLLALDAESDTIVADYLATGPNSDAVMARTRQVIAPLLAQTGVDLDELGQRAGNAEFSPAPMHGLLTYLDETYTDPLEPLRRAGLTDGLLASLRERAIAS